MDHLQTEGRLAESVNLDELTPLELVRLMNAEDRRVAPAVGTQVEVIARAIGVIAERLERGGRLIYLGAGTSGRLGVLDATEMPPTFQTPPEMVVGVIAGGVEALTRAIEGAEDHPEAGARDLERLGVGPRDAVVGIATSGRTPYVLGGVRYARQQGAVTIGIACNPDAELVPLVDLAILPVVGPEVLSGSTRLKAGTATKLVLNMLSTGAMVRLGKTYGHLMVDLKATNEKLRWRANRIVREVTGLSREAAAELLDRCGGEVKTALVMHLAGVDVEQARERLQWAGGRVRQALVMQRSPMVVVAAASDWILGVDGGGSQTTAALARWLPGNNWEVVGRGTAGPSNLRAVGTTRALAALQEAIGAAFVAAGVPRQTVRAACLGLAGAGRAAEQRLVREWAEQHHWAATVEVIEDAVLPLAAGTPEGWGLAVIAGTGSMALAQDPAGRTARAGGWGWLLGDEGSGYALSCAALRAVASAADGRGPSTVLTERLLAACGLEQPEELIGYVYAQADRATLAAFAPIVLDCAAIDPVAHRIVLDGAAELAAVAATAAARLALPATVPLALAGGLFLSSKLYRDRFLHALAERGYQAHPLNRVSEPVLGAVRRAARLASAQSPSAVAERS
jgi:N-acetylmuramic acid 6-phosphate etherase